MQSYFKDNSGDTLIPIADGDFFTDDVSIIFPNGACWIRFYDADGVTPITPTGGTIDFKGTGIEDQYQASADGQIDATTVTITDATYIPTRFQLPVIKSKMTLAGITGASFVKAFHLRW